MGLGDLLHPLPLAYPSPSLSLCPAQHSTGNTTTPPHRLAYHHNTHRPILSPFLQLPYLEHPSAIRPCCGRGTASTARHSHSTASSRASGQPVGGHSRGGPRGRRTSIPGGTSGGREGEGQVREAQPPPPLTGRHPANGPQRTRFCRGKKPLVRGASSDRSFGNGNQRHRAHSHTKGKRTDSEDKEHTENRPHEMTPNKKKTWVVLGNENTIEDHISWPKFCRPSARSLRPAASAAAITFRLPFQDLNLARTPPLPQPPSPPPQGHHNCHHHPRYTIRGLSTKTTASCIPTYY